MEFKVDVNIKLYDKTALTRAVLNNNIIATRLLLEADASVDVDTVGCDLIRIARNYDYHAIMSHLRSI